MRKEILKRTLRFPVSKTEQGNGQNATIQLDAALMKSGFKLSQELFEYFSNLHPSRVTTYAKEIISVVKKMVGDHVKHNTYFKKFPENVPDTESFWMELIIETLQDSETASKIEMQLSSGYINLLDLKGYGTYQHTYEDMLEVHEKLIPSLKDRMTIIHLGKSLKEESVNLYHQLASSRVPLKPEDINLLQELAEVCADDPQPENIPIRENRAIINAQRITKEKAKYLLIDSPTDILRLYCCLSNGDITLLEPTKFISLPRKTRKKMLKELNKVLKDKNKFQDILKYKEEWKRMGERLHPYETKMELVHDAFAIARGDKKLKSFEAQVEQAFMEQDMKKVLNLLQKKPGILFRNLDRILRNIKGNDALQNLENIVESSSKKVSGRVLLSTRQHLTNRLKEQEKRIFTNKRGKTYIKEEDRESIPEGSIYSVNNIIDKEISNRLPAKKIILDESMAGAAIPISEKNLPEGFSVFPRGSVIKIGNPEILRFFCYWKEENNTTDWDLSAGVFDEKFNKIFHISFTHLKDVGSVHSGDIVQAPKGASEFIDVELSKVKNKGKYVVPIVLRYRGENFMEVEEGFFGFMERTKSQKGKPFEAKTVKNKSDMFGSSSLFLPLIFIYEGGEWYAKWINIISGNSLPGGNVENHKNVIENLIKSYTDYQYLDLEYLTNLFPEGEKILEIVDEEPEGAEHDIVTLQNISTLIPE